MTERFSPPKAEKSERERVRKGLSGFPQFRESLASERFEIFRPDHDLFVLSKDGKNPEAYADPSGRLLLSVAEVRKHPTYAPAVSLVGMREIAESDGAVRFVSGEIPAGSPLEKTLATEPLSWRQYDVYRSIAFHSDRLLVYAVLSDFPNAPKLTPHALKSMAALGSLTLLDVAKLRDAGKISPKDASDVAPAASKMLVSQISDPKFAFFDRRTGLSTAMKPTDLERFYREGFIGRNEWSNASKAFSREQERQKAAQDSAERSAESLEKLRKTVPKDR